MYFSTSIAKASRMDSVSLIFTVPEKMTTDATGSERARLCVIAQKYQLGREYMPLHTALANSFAVTRVYTDDGWPMSIRDIRDYRRFDAVLWFVRFRELIKRPAFDWADFRGMRLMYDQDAYQNFSLLAGDRFLNAWPKVYRKQRLDALLCTGEAARDNLREAGVNAIWVPKAYDPARFFDKREPREGVCYFGELYDARAAMLRYLYSNGIQVQRFRCAYTELNGYLNQFAVCVICNMVALRAKHPFPLPAWFRASGTPRFSPGPEVMLKNYEVGASGCVPFCDPIPEMSKLGFVDGVTMVSYSGFSDLADKLSWYLKEPHKLRQISDSAARLCANRHTWDHRAQQIATIISSYLRGTQAAVAR
jgi:glycosyl transferase family 1